jgi:2-methylcitrate dehydratase PrpD
MNREQATVALVHLADFLAVGGTAASGSEVRSLMAQGPVDSWPQAPISRDPGSIYQAAVANATAAHLLDWDDVMLGVPNHPGSVIWPALLACAEPSTAVRRLCECFLEGVGMAAELAGCLGPGHYAAGWHATATVGRLAAAYAAGLLVHDDSDTAWNGMQLASITSSGFTDVFGTSAKSVQVGLATGAAVHAALLAAAVTDMPDVLVPESSLGRVIGILRAPVRNASYVSDDALAELRIKEFPCCYFAHAPVLAAQELNSSQPIETGESIVLVVSASAARVCKVSRPGTIDEARFSLPYLVASALEGDRDGALGLLDGSVLVSSETERRASDVSIQIDPDLPDMTASVHVGERRVTVSLEDVRAGASERSVRNKASQLPTELRELIHACLSRDEKAQDQFLDSPVAGIFTPSTTPSEQSRRVT